jgi:hypothetical protein
MSTEPRSLAELFGTHSRPRAIAVSHERMLFGIVKIILGVSVLCAFFLWQQAMAA